MPAQPSGSELVALAFRGGIGDETLPTSGLHHLLEHLAFGAVRRHPAAQNATVALAATLFLGAGSRAECQAFVADLCAALVAPPLADLERERRVLIAEALGRRPDRHLALRYGMAGVGLAGAWEELGVRHLGEDVLRARAAELFTRANAVVVTTLPPAELDIALPVGRPLEAAPAPIVCCGALPAWELGPPGEVVIGATARHRTAASGLAIRAIERAAMERLRYEDGHVYGISSAETAVGGGIAHVVIGARCDPVASAVVASRIVEAIDDAADGRTDADVLARLSADYCRWLDDPAQSMQVALLAGIAAVAGEQIEHAELLAAARSADPTTCAETAAELRASLLAIVPPGAAPALDVPRLSWPAPAVRAGSAHRFHANHAQALHISDEGITLRTGAAADDVAMPWSAVEAIVHLPGRAVRVLDRSGSAIEFAPEDVADGEMARRAVLARAPAGCHVPMTDAERRVDDALRRRDVTMARSAAVALAVRLGDDDIEHLVPQPAGGGLAITRERLIGVRRDGVAGPRAGEIRRSEIAGLGGRLRSRGGFVVGRLGGGTRVALNAPDEGDRAALGRWAERPPGSASPARAADVAAAEAVAIGESMATANRALALILTGVGASTAGLALVGVVGVRRASVLTLIPIGSVAYGFAKGALEPDADRSPLGIAIIGVIVLAIGAAVLALLA